MHPTRKITYITRDIERALGMDPGGNYRIIANKTPYSETIAQRFPDHVWLVEDPQNGQKILGTRELMEDPKVREQLTKDPSNIIVFKNTERVEEAATTAKLAILNPKATLSERVENKITQIEWLGELANKYLPEHSVLPAKEIKWTGEPFILQWAHGHTGGGTILITSENELVALREKFPHRMTRKSTFVKGPSFTVNAVVAGDVILMGNISYQITGLAPFTDSPFATVGNDWALTHSQLSDGEISQIEVIVREIGEKLRTAGWRGLYGVDVIRNDEQGTINLIEINARQPASVSFESFLQNENRLAGVAGITTFEAHILALLGEPVEQELIPVNDGAQIIQRVTKKVSKIASEKIATLEKAGYNIIAYTNTTPNEDLVRVQCPRGIMETHGQLNVRGKEIAEVFSDK